MYQMIIDGFTPAWKYIISYIYGDFNLSSQALDSLHTTWIGSTYFSLYFDTYRAICSASYRSSEFFYIASYITANFEHNDSIRKQSLEGHSSKIQGFGISAFKLFSIFYY